jgi:hypothetical protein
MAKKEAASKKEPAVVLKSIEEMILNHSADKYTLIPLAAAWAKVLRRKEEYRHLTTSEILSIALREVLNGAVDWKDVKTALSALGPIGEAAANGTGKSKS